MRVLDPDRVEVRDNSEWLDPMTMAEIMSYAREVTVARLLERDDFARRHREHLPISLVEFFYPLLQGIDSVAVHSDVELGGTDQTFNNLMGRDLQRAHGQPPQAVLTVPLLVGTDGVEKMGKSLGNWIGIEEPADEQFGKVMSIPDAGDRPLRDARHRPAAGRGGRDRAGRGRRRPGGEPGQAPGGRARWSSSTTAAEAAEAAERRFDTVLRQHEVPDDVPERSLPPGDPVHLPALLVELGFAKSSSAGPPAGRRRRGPAGRRPPAGPGVRPRPGSTGRARARRRPAKPGPAHRLTPPCSPVRAAGGPDLRPPDTAGNVVGGRGNPTGRSHRGPTTGTPERAGRQQQ